MWDPPSPNTRIRIGFRKVHDHCLNLLGITEWRYSNCLSFFYYLIFLLFFKLYFIDYTITVVHISPFCPPPSSTPHSFRLPAHLCPCPWVMHTISLATPFPILYFTSPWLFCNTYLHFLISSPLHSFLPIPLPSGNHQMFHDSVSVLFVCLVCFF